MMERGRYVTAPIEAGDVGDFRSGKHALDDYFARHALRNDAAGIGRAYVLRRGPGDPPELPSLLGFYTLSMATVEPAQVQPVFEEKLPRYPMPVALIGRLAVDRRAQRRGLGERLLIDALARVRDASEILGCVGVIVDAKEDAALAFYESYDFVALEGTGWPRRLFLPISTARAAFDP